MEIGLVCVFSANPHVRAHVDHMARQLVPIENSTQIRFDTSLITLHARIASWTNQPDAHDPATGTYLVMLGRAWLGNREIGSDTLLQNVLRDGQTALTHLGGSFAVFIWQSHTETLQVVTDRLGTKKIYAWRSAKTILLATELRALLGHPQVPRVIDEVAVGQFLITSHLVDKRSLIRDVHILPPGTIARIDRSAMSFHCYWTPRINPAHDDGLDAWADRLADVLSPAVRARCGNAPPLLPLSGGLDSRSVAAFIPPNLAATATAYSFGHSHCLDVRYGRRVACALGATFNFLPVPEDFFRSYLEPVHALCDGEVSIEALPMYRLMDSAEPGRTMLMGFLGDVLSSGHLKYLARLPDEASRIESIWHTLYQKMGFSDELLQCTVVPERYQAMRGSVRQLMLEALEKAEAPTLDEKALIVELHHRQSRYVSYFARMLSARYRVENPFLDIKVLDTFLAMPLIHRQGQRAYRRMLVRHAPQLAAIPETKTHRSVTSTDRQGKDHTATTSNYLRYLPTGAQWRLNGIRHMLGDSLVSVSAGWFGPHNRDTYAHHDESIRRVAPEWFRARLIEDSKAKDWFHLPALERIFEEHMAHKQDHSIRINNVVSFLAWLKAADA